MPDDEQWRRILREAMADQAMRQRRPQPDELIDYLEGRLAPEERERIEEAAAVDPEVARELADLAAFPDVEPAPGVDEPSEADVAAAWDRFRPRLAELRGEQRTAPPASSAPPRTTARPAPRRQRPASPPRPPFRWPLAQAAAVFFFATTVALLTYLAFLPDPETGLRANVAVEQLAPLGEAGRRDGGGAATVVPPDAPALVLLLAWGGEREFPSYRIRLAPEDGEALWTLSDARRFPDGTFRLEIPRSRLASGAYRLELEGVGPEGTVPLASYRLAVEVE